VRGRQLVTLEDAATYIMKLPKAEQDLEEWQTAVACLLRALNRNVERTLTDRKEMHWGKAEAEEG
jgi:hypothetical protein